LSSATTFTVKEVFDLLRDDLAAIEVEFERGTVSQVSAITDIGSYLRAGGGKRIRPALLLLSSKLMGYTGSGAVRLGAVVEIVHTATLVHDDIIDEAEIRRGRPSANTTWGNSRCVLAGDWLYMQAFRIALQERNLKVLDVLIELTQQMVEGELLQMEKLGKCVGLKEHYDLIFRKTACLFATSMRLGGILGGATDEEERNLEEYGRNLGMAFQIVDDVLDLTASEEVLGKPVASDLREGKVTMAVIHALERCSPEERLLVETVLKERAFQSVSHEQILDILNRYGSIESAYAAAAEYSEAARKAICGFPDSEIKRALLWMPEFVVEREK
jgi:octaprenyl-diphosphate synthase